ncbi:MAG: hypothetical protein ACE5HO_06550 [bacterium]
MLIRGDKVWRNTIPNETLYQSDRIVTLDDGFVAFILRDTKEMMAVRPFSEMVIVGGKQTGINFHEIIPILKLKIARNPFEQISTSVAGVKG